jgi:hypothetical protein
MTIRVGYHLDVRPLTRACAGRAPRGETLSDAVPTYKGLGFLAWDDNEGADGERDPAALRANFAELVRGVGQEG